MLKDSGAKINMDGRRRALDNVFVERLCRSLKYEEVYLNDYRTVIEATEGLRRYFRFYNEERLHQALGYRPPAEAYGERARRDAYLEAAGPRRQHRSRPRSE